MVFLEIAIIYCVQQLAQHYVNFESDGDGGNNDTAATESRDDNTTPTADGNKQQQQVSGPIHLEPDDHHPHDYVASETNHLSTRSSSTITTAAAAPAAADVRDNSSTNNEPLKTMYVPFHDSNSNAEWNEWRDEVSTTFSKHSSNQMLNFQNTLDRAREQIDKSSATISRVWDDLQAKGQRVEQQAMKNTAELWTGLWENNKKATMSVSSKLTSSNCDTTATSTTQQGDYVLSSSPTNSSSRNGLLLQSTQLSQRV